MKNQIEIMAPAGSWEALSSALKAGADSIYFGVEQLNMRAKSSNNFTTDDLKKVAALCAEHNAKSYITLNTILYDHDLRLMRDIVDAAKEAGITAIIAADHAVLMYARKKNMEVHISTQANVTNIETVEFFSTFADVMVLSRELSLSQVADMTREIKRQNICGPSGKLIQIEVFAHGALCMAVSGKCYLSLHTHFSSANRGACIQNCRRDYIVTDKETGYELEIDNEYIMSAKDLCTIDFLDKIVDAGVTVLKIEGRGRAADYVYTTTKCYKEAVQAIGEGTYTPKKIVQWKNELSTVYNRGFWDGYYLGRTLGEWSNTVESQSTKRKVYVAKGMNYFPKPKIAHFKMEAQSLDVGDEIIITGPTTGYIHGTINELQVNDVSVQRAVKGDEITFPLQEIMRPSDSLYKLVSIEKV
ncbi:MAG: U32 family peptidase [Bacteroidota bacterium]|nr:U32 family peptidase [Bacteroidota bacterium]